MSSEVSSADEADSTATPWVQVSDDDDGNSRTARVTATIDGRKHRFEIEVSSDVSNGDGLDSNNNVVVALDHQETVNSRGTVRTAQPSDDVYDLVASHDDVQAFVANSDR